MLSARDSREPVESATSARPSLEVAVAAVKRMKGRVGPTEWAKQFAEFHGKPFKPIPLHEESIWLPAPRRCQRTDLSCLRAFRPLDLHLLDLMDEKPSRHDLIEDEDMMLLEEFDNLEKLGGVLSGLSPPG
jgi:hypothetical protein